MKINAYVMAADPAWIESSVLSYYNEIEKLFVSYDENSIGYTGRPIDVAQCLKRLKAVDSQGKMVFVPGHFARSDHAPMENETHQRQCILKEAAAGADWVLQLDTDEAMADPEEFLSCLREADEKGFGALNYPSRWLYKRLSYRHYLENCSRFWQIVASYPGSLAIKSSTQVNLARQTKEPTFHVDFKPKSTDPARSEDTVVHRVIRADQAIMHYSMVRSEKALRQKTETWSHATDRNWNPEIEKWLWSGRHPLLATLITPLVRNSSTRKRLRISRIAPPDTTRPKPRNSTSNKADV